MRASLERVWSMEMMSRKRYWMFSLLADWMTRAMFLEPRVARSPSQRQERTATWEGLERGSLRSLRRRGVEPRLMPL